jgi:hypothetical protein
VFRTLDGLTAVDGMLFHLGIRQRSGCGFQQDTVRNTHFTDIME